MVSLKIWWDVLRHYGKNVLESSYVLYVFVGYNSLYKNERG